MATVSNPAQRDRTIQDLTHTHLDLLIIGGGIVGSGIARDAAMRGLDVGLIEQQDFAFGTSSRSSRLLHGGMRYLAQGRIGLVHEASVEKKIIHKIAPHLTEPLPFVFPTYSKDKDWLLWQLKLGVKIYDLLCHGRNLGKSSWLSNTETLKRVRGLSAVGLQGAVRYFDGFTNDARLVMDTLHSAQQAGACLLNYCRGSRASKGRFWQCTADDRLAGTTFQISARAVINATGPWGQSLPQSSLQLRLTKGVHLVVNRPRLSVPETVVMTEGKRILFAIPWGERTILGTTDTDYQGDLESVQADAADIAYILGVTNGFFPSAKLTDGDVISTWAGLRPLLAERDGNPSDISRSHQIRNPQPGWWDVAGGKLTTYRLIAEQTVDRVLKSLLREGLGKRQFTPCRTADEPLRQQPESHGFSGIVPPAFTREAVEHYCTREWAVHLADVMRRRTSWHYYLPDAAEKAKRVADWMREILGWSEETRKLEIGDYQADR